MNAFFWKYGTNPDKRALLDAHVVGGSLLDVGSGPGWYARHCHDHGRRTVALDAVDYPERPAGPLYVRGDACRLPFAAGTFDTVVAFDVIEHIVAEDTVIAELGRVARRRLILSVPATDPAFLAEHGLCLIHHVDTSHVRTYSQAELVDLLVRHGWRVVHVDALYNRRLPFVLTPLFGGGLFAVMCRKITTFWVRLLLAGGVLRTTVPVDYVLVAEKEIGAP